MQLKELPKVVPLSIFFVTKHSCGVSKSKSRLYSCTKVYNTQKSRGHGPGTDTAMAAFKKSL